MANTPEPSLVKKDELWALITQLVAKHQAQSPLLFGFPKSGRGAQQQQQQQWKITPEYMNALHELLEASVYRILKLMSDFDLEPTADNLMVAWDLHITNAKQ